MLFARLVATNGDRSTPSMISMRMSPEQSGSVLPPQIVTMFHSSDSFARLNPVFHPK
jgi:hypothetical protein